MSGRGAGRLEVVTAGGAANATVHAGGEAMERAGKKGERRPLFFGDGVEVGGKEAKWTGQRVRVVLTSFTNSVSLARSHCRQWGPDRTERKVRGEPDGSSLRTGAPAVQTAGREVDKSKNQVE